MKYYHIKNNLPKYMLIFAAAISAGSCTDDFLEPDPLSIYEPTKTFTHVKPWNRHWHVRPASAQLLDVL